MSSFPGRMKEYPAISIDRFDRENLHARAYFLSHCHKDHMKGLKGPLLKRKLKFSLTVKLYCSFVTKELLLNNPKYAFWEDRIVALELDSPTHISLIDEVTGEVEDVVVTLLPAGHCPGSVMFLFEGAQGTVLYTGDFRLAAGDAARMEHLHSGNRVKDIQSVYVDSTFYDPSFYQIPSREACLAGIRKLVKDWICLSPYHVVWLNCKAAYGYEYLFTNLGLEFNLQVHVNSLNMYRQMPEIVDHVTTNRATQIHACRHPKDDELFRANRLPCGSSAPDGTPLRIISIKPSTMWFGERTRKTNVIVKMGGSSYRACFSFHSSYSEIKDFLSYISPVNIYPNVIPMGRTVEDVTELLTLMRREHSKRAEVVYMPLGKLKRARTKSSSKGSDSDDELFGEVAVAPMRKKLAANEEKEQHCSEKTDLVVTETQILPQLQPSVQTSNYMDCTESNDDEDDDDGDGEDEAKEEQLPAGQAPGDTTPTPSKPAPPSWSTFFRAEPVVTDDSAELENSQNSQTLSSDQMTSQSPELFNHDDDESESGHMTSSQSTYVSEAALESLSQLDTMPVQCNTTHAENAPHWGTLDRQPGVTDVPRDQCDATDHTEPASDSQVSSDFDLPMTPGSKAPQPEELKELYRKLAAGEEVTTKHHQQGSV
ncbi:protein artemis [Clarias gariepinus]|uniref:protein artemis isoform X2 n=1 Tax=Clarias gariepinus TaxID=13013 RepID=UPI00234D1131|nr:protein artemis isoform X2 [Clarias gariepinus]